MLNIVDAFEGTWGSKYYHMAIEKVLISLINGHGGKIYIYWNFKLPPKVFEGYCFQNLLAIIINYL